MSYRTLARTCLVAAVAAIAAVSGCAAPTPEAESFVRLDADEADLLASHPAPGEARDADATIVNTVARFGVEPYRLLAVDPAAAPDGARRYVVLLRNQSEVVLLDDDFAVVDRAPAPRSPTGWHLVDGRYLFVSGELSNEIHVLDVHVDSLQARAKISLEDVGSVRDLTVVGDDVYALDNFDHRLLRLELPDDWRGGAGRMVVQRTDYSLRSGSDDIGAGALSVTHAGGALIINTVLEHRVAVVPVNDGTPDFSRASGIVHDGPIWAVEARAQGGGLLLALAGVEDRPLDRTGGEFGYVDSFVFVYRVPIEGEAGARSAAAPALVASLNVSELGVVTPKALRFTGTGRLWVSGFGSERLAELELVSGGGLEAKHTRPAPPGITDFTMANDRLVGVSTLLDRVVVAGGGAWSDWQYVPIAFADEPHLGEPHNEHAVDVRIGEALFFSTLFAPDNETVGELSRFTCETCHFEGTFDGRTHFTGRDQVFATTKTLRGLANNVPLFTRAGDPTMSTMIMGEFRVANQGRRAFFDIALRDHPWLEHLGVDADLTPDDQRRAFLAFLVDYTHAPNPWVAQGRRLDDQAVQGLEVFRDRCAACHQAVTSTRESGESVPFAAWRQWLETESWDPVWGAALYTKTGIEPYVAVAGARVPSLRRVKQKYPYFTNGSSQTLRDVLERYRHHGAQGWHDPSAVSEGGGEPLTAQEVTALLRLLEYF